MKFWALLIMGAVSPFLFSTTLTTSAALVFLLLLALLFLMPRLRIFCLLPAFALLTTLAINERLSQRWPLSESKTRIELSGVISSLPEASGDVVRFNFLPDRIEKSIPEKIRVYWYKGRHEPADKKTGVPEVRAGERWRLQLELRPPRGRINLHGVDAERWYFTDGIGALAYVQPGDNVRLAHPGLIDLQHWRQSVLDKLAEKAADVPSFRMLAALAIADRRALLGRDRTILSATGTGHLLAISGLHIGLAAAMGFYLGRLILLVLSVGMKQRWAIVLPWLTAWSASLVYSILSGFGVSTQRALIMLTVATVVLLSRRNIHPFHAWLVAMALVLMVDPFAPLRAGFWFSFTAVAVLMMLFVPRYGHMPGWKRMLFAQLGISLLMAPLGMYWFQQASLPGLLANLMAIPVISLLVVPLILIALLVLWLPGPLAEWLLTAAGYSVHYLFLVLEQLSTLQPPLFNSTRVPALGATILAMLGAALLLLPRGLPGRYAGVLLLLPMLFPTVQSLGDFETRIDFLDVGQGLAVLIATKDYLMVYDTGPGNGLTGERGWNMVDGTITPMIKAQARSPDMIVVSHADLDHAGGLQRLHTIYPNALYLASMPLNKTDFRPCRAPYAWISGKLTFRLLHPSTGLPYLGNDSSCVISVNGPGTSLLLSGDISEVVEQRLVETGLQQHDILTAPHHGSSTSSSQTLIDAVKPSWVLISAAMNNRFGFPRADVVERYKRADIPTLNTALCGGIRLTSNETGVFRVETARWRRNAIWRWPADASCPVAGKL